MNQQFFKLLKIFFILIDLLMINISFVFDKYFYTEKTSILFDLKSIYLWLFINIAWISASWVFNIYGQKNISSFESFSHKTLTAFVYLVTIVLLYLFAFKQVDMSRLFIMTFLFSIGMVIFVNRLLYLAVIHFFRKTDYLIRKVIIVGYNDVSKKLVQQLEEDPINTKIIGYCENEQNINELSNYPIVGGLTNIIEISQQYNATEIYSTIAPEQNEAIYQLMQKADDACIRFKLIPDFNFFTRLPVHIDYFGSIPVLSLRKEPLEEIANRLKKRFYDLIISSLVIIFILSWLIPIISLLIKINSKGPIFFIQKRSGKDNKTFDCIKFRSMRINKDSHSLQASKNDPRITRLGRFLRHSSLDEFPQFLNVFMGQMSIVGPRPHMLKHTNDYSAIINKYMVRHFMKPGITGWAQINGFRGETRSLTDMEKRVEYDIWYMENWSLWLDTRIIFLTFYRLFTGDKKAF